MPTVAYIVQKKRILYYFEKNRCFYCFTFKASPETRGNCHVMPTVAYIVQKKDTVLLC